MIIRRKIRYLAFAIFFLICATFSTNASAYASDDFINESFLINQEIAFKNYDKIKTSLERTRSENNYGGAYIDLEGNLNVNLCGDKNKVESFIRATDKSDNIIYHDVSFSLEYLMNTKRLLESKMTELGIYSISLDESENRIIVGLRVLDDYKVEEIKQLINSEAVVFEQDNSEFTNHASLNGGAYIHGFLSGGLQYQEFSIGFPAKKTSGGSTYYGFVTTGHIDVPLNSKIYNLSTEIGVLDTVMFSGSVDASFVRLTGSTTVSNSFSTGEKTTGYSTSYIEGASVSKYGFATGKTTGVIVSSSVTFDEIGHPIYDVVKCTYTSTNGDSGGAVVFNNTGSIQEKTLAGINKGISTNKTTGVKHAYFIKISNIMNGLSVTPTF